MACPATRTRSGPGGGMKGRMSVTDRQLGLLGLTPGQLATLLDELDQADREPSASKRRSPRRAFRSVNVRVHVLNTRSDDDVAFQVPTRNISLHGLAFLHHHMVPVEQRLRIEIPFRKGYVVQLLARVVRCRHIRGMIHEVGVEFTGKLKRETIPGMAGTDAGRDAPDSLPSDKSSR
jgi:hypothetical protein